MNRIFKLTVNPWALVTGLIGLFAFGASAQEMKKHEPIIDVHVHAMKMNPAFARGRSWSTTTNFFKYGLCGST